MVISKFNKNPCTIELLILLPGTGNRSLPTAFWLYPSLPSALNTAPAAPDVCLPFSTFLTMVHFPHLPGLSQSTSLLVSHSSSPKPYSFENEKEEKEEGNSNLSSFENLSSFFSCSVLSVLRPLVSFNPDTAIAAADLIAYSQDSLPRLDSPRLWGCLPPLHASQCGY